MKVKYKFPEITSGYEFVGEVNCEGDIVDVYNLWVNDTSAIMLDAQGKTIAAARIYGCKNKKAILEKTESSVKRLLESLETYVFNYTWNEIRLSLK